MTRNNSGALLLTMLDFTIQRGDERLTKGGAESAVHSGDGSLLHRLGQRRAESDPSMGAKEGQSLCLPGARASIPGRSVLPLQDTTLQDTTVADSAGEPGREKNCSDRPSVSLDCSGDPLHGAG